MTTTTTMRQCTLEPLGLDNVLSIFRRGGLPVQPGDLVNRLFGPKDERGALVISGASGIVGAGKTMQLGSRLEPFDVPLVALDLFGAPDGLAKQVSGLVAAFGPSKAARVMQNVIRLSYDGQSLPPSLASFRPRFLLEAIPEVLELKRAHYALFRAAFPDIEIRSVTSGFPAERLGVGIAHPAFPHHVNKVWEVVEPQPSTMTQLLWALGLIPVPVADRWSFVLDVLFCGITLAACRYHGATNMPYWKVDKYVRQLLGPNPLRAHDAIGTKGATFLTWTCLHHLSQHYGSLFVPSDDLTERKETGQSWYPPNHFRPLVNWTLSAAEHDELTTRLLGPVLQMAALLVHEQRASLTAINAIGELCAQFRHGVVAIMRRLGGERVLELVERYHALYPQATAHWHPEVFLTDMASPEWQQLYVNAEHDGTVGVITISRELYDDEVDGELNRAIDWLLAAGIRRVIVTGDFHLSTQMVGADIGNFNRALDDADEGIRICQAWSATARRLHNCFTASVGFVSGKRCLGGFLELLLHCHYLVAPRGCQLGFPEVTLPVVPGMEACHWPFRRARPEEWPRLLALLLSGEPVRAEEAIGWLVDFAGPLDQSLATAWRLATGAEVDVRRRPLAEGPLGVTAPVGIDIRSPGARPSEGQRAILGCIVQTCAKSLAEALDTQSHIAGTYLSSPACREGKVGALVQKTMRA